MKPYILNEYDPLIHCLMAYPKYLEIVDDYNKFTKTLDRELAITQHQAFVNLLKDQNISIDFVELTKEPSHVFARDIGFIVKDQLFISKMADPKRESEVLNLIEYAKKQDLNPYIMENQIEGGDVFVHKDKLIIGIGDRTNSRGIAELEKTLSERNLHFEIIKVVFDKSKLHLDCVFNILDADCCILSEGVYNPEAVLDIFPKVIEAPVEEITHLAPNIVNIGNKIIYCSNRRLTEILSEKGYKAIYVEFTEIIKAQGSLGCCVLPMVRKH